MVSRSLYQVEIILGTLDTINHTKLDHVTPHTSQTLSFGTIMSKHSCDERPYYTPHRVSFSIKSLSTKPTCHPVYLSKNPLLLQFFLLSLFPLAKAFPEIPQQELVRPVV